MSAVTRRAALSLLAGPAMAAALPRVASSASLQCPAVSPAPRVTPPMPSGIRPLGDLARARELMLGVALDYDKTHQYDGPSGGGFYDPVYRDIVLRERFNILAYGQGFIFGNVAAPKPDARGDLVFRGADGVSTWYEVDDCTPLIRQANARARVDALIWNNIGNCPEWVKPLPADPNWPSGEAYRFNLAYMEKYLEAAFAKIAAISGGDAGFVHSIGVLNEPIEHRAGDESIWANGPYMSWRGTPRIKDATRVPDYIERALLAADRHRHATRIEGKPLEAKIYINDTSDGGDPSCLQMIDLIQRAKLPLDGIGLECHWQPGAFADPWKPDWTTFGRLLAEIGHRGLEVYITELDVLDYWTSCNGHKGTLEESDRLTSIYYRSFMEEVLRHKAVKMVTCFTPFDRYSWYRADDVSTWLSLDTLPASATHWPRCAITPKPAEIACPRTGIYDELMRPKPARDAIASALLGKRP